VRDYNERRHLSPVIILGILALAIDAFVVSLAGRPAFGNAAALSR
jgi:hypothetical protein